MDTYITLLPHLALYQIDRKVVLVKVLLILTVIQELVLRQLGDENDRRVQIVMLLTIAEMVVFSVLFRRYFVYESLYRPEDASKLQALRGRLEIDSGLEEGAGFQSVGETAL